MFFLLYLLVLGLAVALVNVVFNAAFSGAGRLLKRTPSPQSEETTPRKQKRFKNLPSLSQAVRAIFFVLSLFFVWNLFHYGKIDKVFDKAGYNRILKTGQAASGEILLVRDLNVEINEEAYAYYLEARVRPDDPEIEPYRAELFAVVPMGRIPRLGERIRLKYDPKNPSNVIWPPE